MFKAIIFDFDGVIGDTMNDNFVAWKKAFSAHNVQINPLDYFLLEGMGRFQVAQSLIKKYNLNTTLEESIVNAKEENYLHKNEFKIYPEIHAILIFLNTKKIPVAMVTGASKERVEKSLTKDFLNQFNIIITIDDVKKGKPDPEPYLEAVKNLKLNPADCLVIENAKLGIESAKAAGCSCFAIETTLDKNHLKEADEIFINHGALYNRLRNLFG